MSRVHMNAARCAEYLRGIGVSVTEAVEGEWVEIERETRATRRANRRELKRSCGHFSTHDTTIHTWDDGSWIATYCSDCQIELSRRRPPPPKHREPIPTARTA